MYRGKHFPIKNCAKEGYLFLSTILFHKNYNALCTICNASYRESTPICPGAEAMEPEPKVRQEPKASQERRLMLPMPAMDIVMIGRSA